MGLYGHNDNLVDLGVAQLLLILLQHLDLALNEGVILDELVPALASRSAVNIS